MIEYKTIMVKPETQREVKLLSAKIEKPIYQIISEALKLYKKEIGKNK
jgi:hypothetical protein